MPPSVGSYLDKTTTAKLSAALPLSAPKGAAFRSSVTIDGSAVFIPEQEFLISRADNEIRIENRPTNAWPKIIIDLLADPSGLINTVTDVQISPSQDTAEAEIKYTRFDWAVARQLNFSVDLPGIGSISILSDKLSDENLQHLMNRAKLYRKLRFLEYVFGIRFTLAQSIPAGEVGNIDHIYRGLTSGEFVIRSSNLNLAVPEKEIDWSIAPFNEPGNFPQSAKWYSEYFGETVYLFGHKLDIGTVSIRLEKALYSGPSNVSLPNHNLQQARGIRFEVLDHQIYFRFDKYADKGKKKLQENLAQFQYKFLRDDPKELLELMDEPLIQDVNAEEANLIAMGWIQYNRLPDRYCPQEPVFDEANKSWRVPIYLVYANGEGEKVAGDLVIDAKSGVIIESPQLLDAQRNVQIENEQTQNLSNFDQEVAITARRFMDAHQDLLTRLAK